MRSNISTLIAALVLVAIIVLMMCAYQVRFTETAVLTRFDRPIKVIEPNDAGFHWKWPWPVDRVHRFDARLRAFDTEFRQLGTKDQKTIVMTAYATWRIDDAEKFLTAVGREDSAKIKIRDLLENQVSVVLRRYELRHLVNTNPEALKFTTIEREFLDGIQKEADEQYGIQVVSVGIKRLGIPASVTKEVFARMKADREKEITQLKAEGEAEATQIRADALAKAQKIKARAEAYAKTIEGQGDAQAAKYYEAFAKNRELSDFLKKLETVEKIFDAGQITLVIDAAQITPFDLLKEATQQYEENAGSQPKTDRGASIAAPNTPVKVAGDPVTQSEN